MIEAIIIAGALLASAILIIVFLRPHADPEVRIRMWAKSLVRAIEKRSEWDETLNSSHVKRARLKLFLTEQFPAVSNDWLDIIIEEAVFDMEASNERGKDINSTGSIDRFDAGRPIEQHRDDGVVDVGDNEYPWDSFTAGRSGWDAGGQHFEIDGENLPMPSAE